MHPYSMVHKFPPAYFIFCIIAIMFIMAFGYIVIDFIIKFRRKSNLRKYNHLEFKNYKEILEFPDKYNYYAPYGIENALISFNSETPYLLDIIETCIARNRHLMQRYANNEDPKLLSTYLSIEIQLTTMIATSGINLMNKCKYYCQNCSKSFQLPCHNELIREYIDNAEKVHDQFEVLKNEKFKTTEVLEISKTMYDEFFKFFETINSLLCIYENKVNNKEEKINDE